MKFSSLSLVAATTFASSIVDVVRGQENSCAAEFVAPKLTLHGKILDHHDESKLADVMACCSGQQEEEDFQQELIGKIPQMSTKLTFEVLEDAKQAWKGGSGVWPQMSLGERVQAIENFLEELQKQRDAIVTTLMWEIGKNVKDAESEFDRTVAFCKQVIAVIRNDPDYASSWQTVGSTKAFIRRAAIGIIMCLGPMNYPLNETYATLIPALLMGNVAIMKIPTVGGLSHLLTMEAFAKTLPPGVMNFVSGRGRDTMPPLMKTGDIDALAFIGGSKAADDLIGQHPHPHRLKVFLQLEAKNMGIFLSDLFEKSKAQELSIALDQAVLGSLSFNGQRCTALKLFFIPTAHGDAFASMLAKRIEALNVGLPWQTFEGNNGKYSNITPLPNRKRVEYMQELIEDAVSKGAKIMNKDGGKVIGGKESSLMVPAVLYPVTKDMDIYYEEQFGPIVPITTYDSLDTILDYGHNGIFGQQVSIFLSEGESSTGAMLIDQFSSVFGKININTQCGRSPDTVPFSGRRSSAMGVMSVKDALKEFSIPTVVAYKDTSVNANIVQGIEESSKFLQQL